MDIIESLAALLILLGRFMVRTKVFRLLNAARRQPKLVAGKLVPQRGSVWVAAISGTLWPDTIHADPHATALWY